MHYLIYKITNKLNNKFYVGKHKTENKEDGYFGSGILIERAVRKHGKENFTKEIILECGSEEEMNQQETSIVDEEFVSRDDTYNLALGGFGGADHITDDDRRRGVETFNKRFATDTQFKKAISEKRAMFARIRNLKYGCPPGWPGATFSEETRKKMSESGKGKRTGENNGVFGKHWVTNGIESRMVDKSIVPDGWRKGHNNNKGGQLTEEHKKNLSNSHKGKGTGKNNSVFGKHWITNGKENVLSNTVLPGWWKGRTSL